MPPRPVRSASLCGADVGSFTYEYLTDDDRVTLLKDRLRRLEAQHFNLCLETRICEAVGDRDATLAFQVDLAGLEVKADCLRTILRPTAPAKTEEEKVTRTTDRKAT